MDPHRVGAIELGVAFKQQDRDVSPSNERLTRDTSQRADLPVVVKRPLGGALWQLGLCSG